MRIVIDMQGAQSESRFRGIGRYSLSLAHAIARNAGEHEIWLVLNARLQESILDIRDAFRELIPQEHICVFELPFAVAESNSDNENMARVAELLREYFLEQLKPDVVLVTSLFEGYEDDAVVSVGKILSQVQTAVVLYDLIPYMHQEKYLYNSNNQYNYYMRKIDSLKNANLLLSISESSKSEAVEVLGINESNITNISTAVDVIFEPLNLLEEEKNILHKKYNITRNMLMYAPGGFDERKNFNALINAYALLSQELRKNHQLVIVSKIKDEDRHNLNQVAKNAGLEVDELIITGYVSDEDLIALYNTAVLFVFPSKHEGFGLPVLEAMSCGTVVIGSNTTSIPEVIGCKDALFDPESIESIRDKIEEVLTNVEFKTRLLNLQQEHKKIFSWDSSAKNVLEKLPKIVSSEKTFCEYSHFIDKLASLLFAQNTYNDQILLSVSNYISKNTPSSDKKTLYVDITQLHMQDFGTGIQRVVRSIISELFLQKDFLYNIELINLEYSDSRWNYRKASKYKNKFVTTDISTDGDIVEPKNSDIFLGLDLMSWIIDAEKQKLLTAWKYKGVKISFVVYDILPILYPHWWPGEGFKIHTEWLKTILKVADDIISISDAVSKEVQQFAIENHSENKNVNYSYFHLGADINNSIPSKGLPKDSENILEQLESKSTFLMVGTLEPRKGHMQTLIAFEQLWSEGKEINLIIIGKEGWLVDELIAKLRNHPELNKRLFWLEGISDEYLEKVYEVSTCLIAASEGEGFGLPLIESAQHKLPIIARDIPVFREVAGEYAYYFENRINSDIIANAIKNWLELYKEEKHPKSDDMPWLTWQESSKQLLNCLKI